MKITPFILGRGRAGNSIWESLSILKNQMPEITWSEPIWLARGEPFKKASDGLSIAYISNPNALHADRMVEAQKAGFDGIVCEKPSCVTLEQAEKLSSLPGKIAILHVYRQAWGPQEIKRLLTSGAFGKIVSIEGRYWQSSAAERAMSGEKTNSWKNDINLVGPSDGLLDVGVHWADMAIFFAGHEPQNISGWSSYINAEAPHRDTHIHMRLEFKDFPALTSISKTFHGGTNNLEIHVIGEKMAASWHLQNPDELVIGEGRNRKVVTRKTTDVGSRKPPFHGTGWLEGYIEIIRQHALDVLGRESKPYPTLKENVSMIRKLLQAKIIRN